MTTPEPVSDPTVLRMMLGGQLRRLREARNITREEAAWQIRGSASKLSRLELGRVKFKRRDVADLLTIYGVTEEGEREALLSLVEDANKPSWWQKYSEALPSWFHAFVGLEQVAAQIRAYETQFVPGLLQTQDYARLVITAPPVSTPREELEQRVKLRLERQDVLAPPRSLRLWVVLEEAVLHRVVGRPEVMREQLEHLLAAAAWPNVTLQVLPFRNAVHSVDSGPFTLLRFREAGLPDIAYTEQLTGALYMDRREDVEGYVAAMDQLSVSSLTPPESEKLIGRRLKHLTGDSG